MPSGPDMAETTDSFVLPGPWSPSDEAFFFGYARYSVGDAHTKWEIGRGTYKDVCPSFDHAFVQAFPRSWSLGLLVLRERCLIFADITSSIHLLAQGVGDYVARRLLSASHAWYLVKYATGRPEPSQVSEECGIVLLNAYCMGKAKVCRPTIFAVKEHRPLEQEYSDWTRMRAERAERWGCICASTTESSLSNNKWVCNGYLG
jgi:hypothetical protein